MQFPHSIKAKLLAAMLLLNLVAVGSYTIYLYQVRKADIYDALDKRLVAAAHLGAEIAPQSVHDEAINGNLTKEQFDHYQSRLYRYAAASGVKYVYTVVHIDGAFRFVIDTAQEEEVKTGVYINEPLYEYEEPSEALQRAYTSDQTIFDEYEDEWGEFRSVFIPLKTDAGTRFLAAADIEISEINDLLRETLLVSIAIGIVLFAVSFTVAWFSVTLFLRPISAAQQTIRHITQNMDLTVRIPKSDDEIGKLSNDLNGLFGQLQQALTKAISGASSNASISAELDSTSVSIYNKAKESMNEVGQITKEGGEAKVLLGQMQESLEGTQRGVEHTTQLLAASREQISSVAEMVSKESEAQQELSRRLSQLAKETEQVKNVLSVIGDIADQTNLLALNAAIEAARAGDHGRGFAVVADEVRKLAERTQRSLAETGATINAIVQSIDEVAGGMEENSAEFVALLTNANRAQQAMQESSSDIERTKTVLTQTAANSKNILLTTQNVLDRVVIIGDHTVQSTESIGEISKAASHLNHVSEELRLELTKVKV